jgi:hypothetical protein
MPICQVERFPDGEYQKMEAESAQEAADKHYGRPLSQVGSNHQLRVLVRWPGQSTPMLFYDRG